MSSSSSFFRYVSVYSLFRSLFLYAFHKFHYLLSLILLNETSLFVNPPFSYPIHFTFLYSARGISSKLHFIITKSVNGLDFPPKQSFLYASYSPSLSYPNFIYVCIVCIYSIILLCTL